MLVGRFFFRLFCFEAFALSAARDFAFGAAAFDFGAAAFGFGAEAFGFGFTATGFEVLGLGVGFRSFAGLALLARDVMGAWSATWGLSATSAERYRLSHVGCARSLHELRGTDDTAGRRPDVSL